MARKAKIKVKRGKVKFKFKSDGDVLLHGHDGIQPLLAAALTSATALPAPRAQSVAEAPRRRSLPSRTA